MSSINDISRIAVPRKSFGRGAGASAQVWAQPVQAQCVVSEPVRAAATPQSALPPIAETFETHRVIVRSLALMGRNGVTFLALIAAAALPERVMFHMIQTDLLSPILTLLGCLLLYAAVFQAAMADLRGEKTGLADALHAVKATSAGAYIAIAVTLLSVWFLALIMPSAVDAALAAPVAILEAKGWRDSRARSAAMIAPCRARVRLLLLLLAGLACSRSLALLPLLNLPGQAVQLFLLGGWLFPQLLTAVCATAGAALYHQVRATADGPH